MKISILPKNFTDTEVRSISSVAELGNLVTKFNYSGGVFKNNYTTNENFISSELMILDFDNYENEPQLSLQEALTLFAPYKCLIATTRHHRLEKTSGEVTHIAADRFRVILFLTSPVTNQADYDATWFDVAKRFPALDTSCKDAARRLYKSLEVRLVNETGLTIDPVTAAPKLTRPNESNIRGQLGRQTIEFLSKEAPAGKWNSGLYKAARDYLQNNYSEDEFIRDAEKITGHLDSKDLNTIQSAFSKPAKHPPRMQLAAVERWFNEWIISNQVAYHYGKELIYLNGEEFPQDLLISRLVLDAKYWAEKNPIVTDKGKTIQRAAHSQSDLEHVLGLWVNAQDRLVRERYQEKIEFSSSVSGDPLADWIEAVTGKKNELDIAVMRHFVWQVKRKLYDLNVEWHMMPILSGKTGSGKTEAIRRLFAPIKELVQDQLAMLVMEDTRESRVFGRNFIIFFDEMEKADKVNVEALKNRITAENYRYRILGTHRQASGANVSTFIGASNKDIQDLIFDPTSARRFWQINSLDRMNYELVNNINYLDIWRSIDEHSDTPIRAHLSEIAKVQDDELRVKSLPELWIEEEMVQGTEEWKSSTSLYDCFKEWCSGQDMRPNMTNNRFARIIKKLGIPSRRKGSGTEYNLQIKQLSKKLTAV